MNPSLGLGNGLAPIWHQGIICTNAGLLSIKPYSWNFTEILIEIQKFSSKEMHLKKSEKRWPFVSDSML